MKKAMAALCDKAADLGVIHAEQELGLQPKTFARTKQGLFGQIDKVITDYSNSRAFFITGVAREEILNQARNYILNWQKDHLEAYPDEEFVQGLHDILKEWLPVRDAAGRIVNTAARAEMIARVNTLDLYNYGRYAIFTSPAMKDWVQAFQYSAILDGRTTLLCRTLHGRIFQKEEAAYYRPPNHFNALDCETKILTRYGERPIHTVMVGEEVMTHKGRWRRVYASMDKKYEKPTIKTLHLSTGRELCITDEHPVLTTDGWKAAGDLNVGDVLFQRSEDMGGVADGVMPCPDNYPTLFNEPEVPWDVVRFLGGRVVALPVDFKKNPLGDKCEVNNIAAKRELVFKRDATFGEEFNHFDFPAPDGHPSVTCSGCGGLLRDPSDAGRIVGGHPNTMSRVNFAGSLAQSPRPMRFPLRPVWVGLTICDGALYGPLPDGNTVPFAPVLENGLPNTHISFDSPEGLPVTPMPGLDNVVADIEVGKEMCHESPPGGWIPSTILNIVDADVKGNVWNLAVEEDETYLAEGMVVHNCRSLLLPIVKLDEGWEDAYRAQPPLADWAKPQDGF